MPPTIPPGFSIGSVARRFHVQPWQIRRAIARGFLSEPARIATFRVFTHEELPLVRDALIRAGYLPEEAATP
jgi:hypothetical protein